MGRKKEKEKKRKKDLFEGKEIFKVINFNLRNKIFLQITEFEIISIFY